jgi:hypothetical protein
MAKPEWTEVRVTKRQARAAAEAMWRMEERVRLYAEIGSVQDGTTNRDRIALAEMRRRLYVASGKYDG